MRVSRHHDAGDAGDPMLTERGHEVALAVGRGPGIAEIAATLFLGVPTAKAHIGWSSTKLEVENRVQIALCVHAAGLAGPG